MALLNLLFLLNGAALFAAEPIIFRDADLASLERVGDKKFAADSGERKLLYFWATWCPSCRQKLQNGDLVKLASGSGAEVIAVNTDKEADRAASFVAKYDPGVAIVRDSAKALLGPLRISAVPAWAVLERDAGKKAWRVGARAESADIEAMKQALVKH